MTKLIRPGLLTSSFVLVAASVVGCGGGIPTDASEDEFCAELTSLFTDLGTLADGSEKEAIASIKLWAEGLAEVGTPEDTPDAAREGFELMLEQVGELSQDDTTEDLQKLEADMSESEQQASDAFESYTETTCGEMQLPAVPAL